MPVPTDPPRPSLRSAVRDYLAACVWDQTDSRVENAGGTAIVAWLNQISVTNAVAKVEWEAGTATDLGNAVPATITQTSINIIINGTFSSTTGLITYQSVAYRFRFEVVSGVASMVPYS